MKTHVVVIALLFSLSGFAASVQAGQENGTTPPPQAPPSNGSRAKGQVDKPDQKGGKSAETPSPVQQTSSPNLEESLAGLTKAVTKLVDKQAEQESVPIKALDFSKAFLDAFVALLALISALVAIYKIPWFEKNKPLIKLITLGIIIIFSIVVLAIVLLGLLYLFSGLVTAVLYGFIAIIILLIALLIAAVHLLTFIDEHPRLKRKILGRVAEPS